MWYWYPWGQVLNTLITNTANSFSMIFTLWLYKLSGIWNYLKTICLQLVWKQALKLSAIKGEPNLSIHWEVRQIHLKKWPKRHFKFDKSIIGWKPVSAEKPLLPKICFWPTSLIKFDSFLTDLIQENQKWNSHFYPFCKCDNFY